jgi:FtsH-binding integral membrane protein
MELHANVTAAQVDPAEIQRVFITRVYRWMFLGLGLTAVVAYLVASTPALAEGLLRAPGLRLGLLFGELGLVWGLSSMARRLSGRAALSMFFLYAALNGVSFSVLFFVYHLGSAVQAFMLTAGLFGVMSVYGTVTRKDLSSWSTFLFMGLVGVLIAGVINLFVGNSMASFVISCATVVVFTGLTAYDTQKLRELALSVEGSEMAESMSAVGALELYLDFINLFLALLRLLGRRR